MKIIKKPFLIIIFFGLLVSSCLFSKTNQTANSRLSAMAKSDKKAQVAKELMADFQIFIERIEKSVGIFNQSLDELGKKHGVNSESERERRHALYTNALYDLNIVYSKACGILGAYKTYFKANELKYVSQRMKAVPRILDGNVIDFGYSKSGLYFIALTQPQSNVERESIGVINRIKNDAKESAYLQEIGWNANNGEGYDAVDLYVEDLLDDQKVFKIDEVLLIGDEGEKINFIFNSNDNNLNEILAKYNRHLGTGRLFRNKEWATYIFNDIGARNPKVRIKYQGEVIMLQ